MSAPIKDGGPAFPFDERDPKGQFRQHFGMTLRDWFAGQAMQSLLVPDPTGSEWRNLGDMAKHAYCVADEMIDAREESK